METNPLLALWYALPPNVRQQYTSGLKAVGEFSPGAAVRDVVEASGQVGQGLLDLKPWEVGSGLLNMATAAAGVVPGGKIVTKVAKKGAGEVIDQARKVISPKAEAEIERVWHGSDRPLGAVDQSKPLYLARESDMAQSYADQRALGSGGSPHVTPLDVNLTKFMSRDEYQEILRRHFPDGNYSGSAYPHEAATVNHPAILKELKDRGIHGVRDLWDFGHDERMERQVHVLLNPEAMKKP